jgi:hypothetical protein
MTRRRVVQLLLLVVVALGIWAASGALLARHHVAKARDRIESLRDHGGDADAAVRALDDAARDLRRARGALRQPGPALVARIPVLGRTLVAIRVVDRAALDVVTAARPVLDAVRAEPLVGDKRIDVRRLAALSAALREASTRTERVPRSLGALRTGWTPPGVLANVRTARSKLGGVPVSLRRTADLLDALGGVLGRDGDRRVLVVLENNAELRGTGGLISVVAEMTAHGGAVTMGPFRDIVDIAESKGFARPVPAPADYVARYGRFLANTTLWRNANMTPDVPTSSRILSELATKSTGRTPTAVLMLDVPAIARILGATGPVGLPDGRRLSESNAVDELLSRAYVGVPDTKAGQDLRRARLRSAADAVVSRLVGGDAPAVALAVALGDAAAGRHVTLWSAVPAEQAAFEVAGLGGAVRDDTSDVALVTLHNLGGGAGEGNKLDYYARVAEAVRVRVGRKTATTERTFTLRNTAPASGLPAYVAGVERPGESRTLVSFSYPAGATGVELRRDGEVLVAAAQPEGGRLVLDDIATLDPGAEATWTLRYTTPVRDGRYALRLVPQPLAHDATLRIDVRSARDAWLAPVTYDGPFDRERRIDVRPRQGAFWQRIGRGVRRFWDEPVRL